MKKFILALDFDGKQQLRSFDSYNDAETFGKKLGVKGLFICFSYCNQILSRDLLNKGN